MLSRGGSCICHLPNLQNLAGEIKQENLTGKSKGILNRIPAYILKLVLSGALGENEVEITGRIWNQEYVQELGPQQAELSEPGAKGRNVALGLTRDTRGNSFQGFSFM